MGKLSIGVLVLTVIAAIAQAAWWYPQLPERVPVHFDFGGEPDAWSTREEMTGWFVLVEIGLAILMSLLAFTLRFIPDSLINIPNKEFWLAKERRDKTINQSRQLILWMATVTCWFFMAIFHLSALVGIQKRTSINPEFWLVLAFYLVFVLFACGYMVYKYRLTDESVTPI